MSVLPLAIVGLALLVLVAIAVGDLRRWRITNGSVLVLATLFLAHALAAGRIDHVPVHALVAAIVLAVLFPLWRLGWIGGGDVKILSVAFLWAGVDCGFFLSVAFAAATLVHYGLARAGLVPLVASGKGRKLALAPSVALALGATLLLCIAEFG